MERTHISQHSLTRRNFFRMAVGSFVTLPSVAGGFIVGARKAYAATEVRSEKDGGSSSGTTTIVVVEMWELGVRVADTAFGGDDPIEGAHVVITSRYNNKQVAGDTDNNGMVKFDISGLAEDPDGVGWENLDVFAFNGTVDVTCPGYRDFHMALTRIEGGGGVAAYTRNLKEGEDDPYPSTVALNEWDVLYTQNEFITTPHNDDKQNLSLVFRQMNPGAAKVMLKESDSGKTLMSASSKVGSDGILKASFVGNYLQQGSEGALPEGKLFEIEVEQGDQHTVCPIRLSVTGTDIDDSTQSDEYAITPVDASGNSLTNFNITWPDAIPILGGSDFETFSPDFLVNVCLNPLGYFQLTLSTPSWGYHNDSGDEDDAGWKRFPTNGLKKTWEDGWDDWDKGKQRAKDGYKPKMNPWTGKPSKNPIKKIDMFASIDFKVNLQIAAIAQWDHDTKAFQGMLAGQFFLSIETNVSANFWVGFIPVLISFDFNFSALVSLAAAMYTLPDPEADAKR